MDALITLGCSSAAGPVGTPPLVGDLPPGPGGAPHADAICCTIRVTKRRVKLVSVISGAGVGVGEGSKVDGICVASRGGLRLTLSCRPSVRLLPLPLEVSLRYTDLSGMCSGAIAEKGKGVREPPTPELLTPTPSSSEESATH